MKLVELQELASKGYDGFGMGDYFDHTTGEPTDWHTGDSLEWFMAIEIAETYDSDATDEQQYDEAIRVLESGQRDLQGAITELYHAQYGDK
jgi:uncharacterized protein YqgQ